MSLRHLGILTSDYLALLASIQANGNNVPCEWQPELWFPEDIPEPSKRAEATKEALKGCKACPNRTAQLVSGGFSILPVFFAHKAYPDSHCESPITIPISEPPKLYALASCQALVPDSKTPTSFAPLNSAGA